MKYSGIDLHSNNGVVTVTDASYFATHLPQAGYDIRTIQELLGHKDVARMWRRR